MEQGRAGQGRVDLGLSFFFLFLSFAVVGVEMCIGGLGAEGCLVSIHSLASSRACVVCSEVCGSLGGSVSE